VRGGVLDGVLNGVSLGGKLGGGGCRVSVLAAAVCVSVCSVCSVCVGLC
jgi:hypothetical protein